MKVSRSPKTLFAALIVGMLLVPASMAQTGQPAKTDPPKTEPTKTEPAKTPPAEAPKKEPEKKPAAPSTDTKTATPAKPETAAPKEAPKEQVVYISMKTSMGEIILELDPVKAPISVENFVKYTDSGYYDGTVFHRVIDNFMIQGGGFTADMQEKKPTNPRIKNEWQNGLKNKTGTLAMARLGQGPDSANSASCQFFINVKDNDFLDKPQADGAAYAVFGKVISGMNVVNNIKVMKTENKGGAFTNCPATMVVIEKVKKISKDDADKAVAAAAKK